MEKVLFKEEQRFTQWWLWLIMVCSLLAIVIPILNEWNSSTIKTNSESTLRLLLYGGLAIIFVLVMMLVLLVSKLKTKIRNDGLYVAFPPLRKKWKLISANEIERFELRTYLAIKEYGGYGIKKRRKYGQAYTVSGNVGLQLYFKNGKKLLIGTQKKQAIEYAMNKLMNEVS